MTRVYNSCMDNTEFEEVLPCADKLAFDARREALGAATVALHQHGTRLHVYKCRHCSLWHLASDYSDKK